jgi:hypothetical protein
MNTFLWLCGDTCVRVNSAVGSQYASPALFIAGVVLLLGLSGVLGYVVGGMSEQYANLCDIARERKGIALTFDQNRCNGTTDGRLMSNDWACRNDGYSGYNVASVGESE